MWITLEDNKEWILTKEKTQVIKCLAILFVIMSHCGLMECGGAIGVDLFLIISGFGLYHSYTNSKGHNYWLKRIKAVYFPYLYCTVIFLPIHILLGTELDYKSVVISLLGQDFGFNIDPTMWYISFIFFMYVIAWVYFRFSDNYRYLGRIVVATMVLIVTICGYKHYIWHAGTIAWAYGLSFPIGLFFAESEKEVKKIIAPSTFCFLCLSLALAFVPHEKYVKLLFPLTISLFLFFLIGFCKFKKSFIYKVTLLCGKYSFFIYLNEGLAISLVRKYITNVSIWMFVGSLLVSFFSAFVIAECYNMLSVKLRESRT